MNSPIKLIKTYASFVKLAHTVFALPFAMVGMLAAYAVPYELEPGVGGGWEGIRIPHYLQPNWLVVALILVCMVGARSFAMAVNRILDRKIDALNPRTAVRELPSGAMTLTQAWVFAIGMAVLYFGACMMLGDVVLALSPIPIALMLLYPLTKRFTWFCHLVLGASLGLAPVGAWVAVRGMSLVKSGISNRAGEWLTPGWRADLFGNEAIINGLGWAAVSEPLPWLLGGAVLLWVAGFDVIYALQDDEFDREHRLNSIPARFGRRGALWISRGMHLASAVLFLFFTDYILHATRHSTLPEEVELPQWLYVAPCVMLAGMLYQHSLVKPNDLSRVNLAFFTVNGVISVAFGAVFFAAWLLA